MQLRTNGVSQLADLLPDVIAVTWDQGKWWGKRLDSARGSGMTLEDIETLAMQRHRSANLVFQDEDSIDAFLADSHPSLSILRALVRRARVLRSLVVTTAAELLRMAATGGIVNTPVGPRWAQNLAVTEVVAPTNPGPVFSELHQGNQLGSWCLRSVHDSGAYSYWFSKRLESNHALLSAARYQPQTLLQGEPGYYSWTKDSSAVSVNIPLTDEAILVVPDHGPDPALWISRFQAVHLKGEGELLPATLYKIPSLSGPTCCRAQKVPQRLEQRTMPLDVIAATQHGDAGRCRTATT